MIRREQGSINRIRPKSFQAPETPKTTSFFHLANRYAIDPKIKPACSLPSLVGDQVKLSPDDDRPFLDPIPRRTKSRSLIGNATPLGMFPERNCISLKDLTDADSNWLRQRHRIIGSYDDISKADCRHQKHHYQSPTASSSSIGSVSNDITSKPLPPEPGESKLEENRTMAPKPLLHSLGPNSMMSQLLASKNMHMTRPPLISQKPVVPPRSSSKNNVSKKLIEDQRSRQTPGLLSEHYRSAIPFGRLRPHHTSFESINEESEQASTPKDETAKLPSSDFDHRRSRSEPHERILQNDRSCRTLAPRQMSESELTDDLASEEAAPCELSDSSPESNLPVQMAYDEKVRTLTYNSRASSLQSLTSIASSTRSTTSSKHEQANLRRAVMNVHGQGMNDLSYKVDALLYEIRPKNKHGLCYGILEDSTQGWYPAESVEPYFADQQF